MERTLNDTLSKLEKETSDQLIVVTTPSLDQRPIEQFSREVARDLKVGRADVDNGVVLLIAPTERKLRVEVGYGLEALLTDARAAASIDAMMPYLRSGNFDAAAMNGVSDLVGVLKSDARRPQYRNEERRKLAA